MLDAAHHARPTRKLVGVVLAAVAALVVPAVAVAAPPADKGPAPSAPTDDSLATDIRISYFATPTIELPTEAPDSSLPNAYIVKNVPWVMHVESVRPDTSTPDPADVVAAPLSTTSDVSLELSVVEGSTTDRTKSWIATIPRGEDTAVFGDPTQKFADEWDDAMLEVATVPQKKKDPSFDDSVTFDVLISSGSADQNAALTSIDRTGTSATPCSPTPEDQVCGDLLVNGKATGNGLLSLGACDTNCRGQLVQVLIGLNATLTEPATLVMKCDKSLCKGGSISSNELYFTQGAEEEPEKPAPACPAKGIVGAEGFCVDYVQSTRDNAGDTILYLLFVEDAKVRFL